jgi:hypothetical protein
MNADRIEQAEAADLPVADAPPLADLIAASTAELRREVMRLRATVARLEAPPARRMALKACASHSTVDTRYETVRKWCRAGLVEAKRENGRIFVNLHSVQARLARLRDK